MSLSDAQIERYGRQILLPEVGGEGQERLIRASVSVAGEHLGAEEAARYLAAAGVGRVSVSESLHARLSAEVAARDPEVRVTGPAESEMEIIVDQPDRASGALAALRALVALTGAGSGDAFSWEKHRWWAS